MPIVGRGADAAHLVAPPFRSREPSRPIDGDLQRPSDAPVPGPGTLLGLTIRNFRNLAMLEVALPSDGVVIVGDNGHGKTNFLEAVYYLVLFRSLRGARDRELVRFGEPGFFVAGEVAVPGGAALRVTAGYQPVPARKKVTLDGAEPERLSDAVGRVSAVPFSPADRAIVAAGPGGRRRYLDVLLSLSLPGYLARLTDMRGALRQRNAALRRGRGREAAAFDQPLAESAAAVLAARRRWVDRWAPRFSELCSALGEVAEPRLRYRSSLADAEHPGARIRALLPSRLERDLRRGATSVGPHLDDLEITLGGRDIRVYGSAGQQRTAAIALRLLEAATIRDATGHPPVALYDDVFAELDADRQARLLCLIRAALPGQAIVTAPREDDIPAALLDRARWRMTRGVLG